MPLFNQEAPHVAWWWTRIALLEERVRSIHEAAANDKEGMIAPREYWVSWKDTELDDWYRARRDVGKPQPLRDD